MPQSPENPTPANGNYNSAPALILYAQQRSLGINADPEVAELNRTFSLIDAIRVQSPPKLTVIEGGRTDG